MRLGYSGRGDGDGADRSRPHVIGFGYVFQWVCTQHEIMYCVLIIIPPTVVNAYVRDVRIC